MCTVSYLRIGAKIIITSNRDEHQSRPSAIEPKTYEVNGASLCYPKDTFAGGTWFVAKGNGNVYVLLNGADAKHQHQPPYKKSRGLILLEIASHINFEHCWDKIDLINIEPFTLIVWDDNKLKQVRWNGTQKQYNSLNSNIAQIWSSYTLYEPEIINAREKWYHRFITDNSNDLDENMLWRFHAETNRNDLFNGLVIKRDNGIQTKSITQFVLDTKQFCLNHYDLLTDIKTNITELIL